MAEAPKEKVKATTSEIGKITMSTIGAGKIAKRAVLEEKELVTARIFGIASGIKLRANIAGDKFEAIAGNFEATNMETGEIFGSGILFLPAGLHEKLLEPLKNGEDGLTIQFGLEISAFPAANPSGYSWKAKNIVQVAQADPLADLRKQAMDGMKLLPPAQKKIAAK